MEKPSTIIDVTTPSTTIPDAAQEVGVQPGRLREWIDRKYVTVAAPASTRGDQHLLSGSNIIEAKLFKHLLDRGFYRKFAAEVVDAFRKDPKKHFICVRNDKEALSYKSYSKMKDIPFNNGPTDIFIINVNKL